MYRPRIWTRVKYAVAFFIIGFACALIAVSVWLYSQGERLPFRAAYTTGIVAGPATQLGPKVVIPECDAKGVTKGCMKENDTTRYTSEPGSLALVGAGVIAIFLHRRQRV